MSEQESIEELLSLVQGTMTEHIGVDGVLTKLVILAEFTTSEGKRFVHMSSDAAGIALKPWDVEGFLTRGLINSAKKRNGQ